MKSVKIYTMSSCPFCINAKNLLRAKGIKFEEINISGNEAFMINKLAQKTGIYTIPQIFADEKYIGGCDDIYRLERQNKLLEALS